jgi:probable F420-dependent oxidoreductase
VKFVFELPVSGDSARPDAIVAVATAAERAGVAALAYTDHPAPSKKWMEGGGHSTLDPFAALCFVAGVTKTIGLMPYLAVLPYRNPLLLAKLVATVDRLSGGRFTLVAGTGYLRSEFAALGASFEDRNERFDETIDVLRQAYTNPDGVHYEGSDFKAFGVVYDPPPVQLPHPPIWIGGNSMASRRRVAQYGAGWAPLRADAGFSKVVRTGVMSSDEDFARAIAGLREMTLSCDRDPDSIDIMLAGGISLDGRPDATIERVWQLRALGATYTVIFAPPAAPEEIAEQLERFGEEVIARLG